jgi:hypothetical protein
MYPPLNRGSDARTRSTINKVGRLPGGSTVMPGGIRGGTTTPSSSTHTNPPVFTNRRTQAYSIFEDCVWVTDSDRAFDEPAAVDDKSETDTVR